METERGSWAASQKVFKEPFGVVEALYFARARRMSFHMSEHWTGKYPNSHKVPKSKRSKFSNSHSSKDICWQWVSKSHCWQLSTLPSLMEAKVFNSRAMYCRSSTFSSSEVNRFSTAAWYSPTYITRSDAIPSVNPRLAMTTEDWTIWHCVLLYRHQKRRGWIGRNRMWLHIRFRRIQPHHFWWRCNNTHFPSVLWHFWLGDRKGIRPAKQLGVGL